MKAWRVTQLNNSDLGWTSTSTGRLFFQRIKGGRSLPSSSISHFQEMSSLRYSLILLLSPQLWLNQVIIITSFSLTTNTSIKRLVITPTSPNNPKEVSQTGKNKNKKFRNSPNLLLSDPTKERNISGKRTAHRYSKNTTIKPRRE